MVLQVRPQGVRGRGRTVHGAHGPADAPPGGQRRPDRGHQRHCVPR